VKILFVENHARFARLTAKQFLSQHEVTIVSSLCAAREIFDQNFEIVLVDYDLDDGKGDELVRELSICAQQPKIIAVSSHQFGNDALLDAGADAVCGKMRFAKIAQTIETLFETRSP